VSSFSTYLIGFVVLIVGLALAAHLAKLPGMWIGVGVIVLLGAGIVAATTHQKPRDPPTT
jgi:uncharacterized membrane protein YiaA